MYCGIKTVNQKGYRNTFIFWIFLFAVHILLHPLPPKPNTNSAPFQPPTEIYLLALIYMLKLYPDSKSNVSKLTAMKTFWKNKDNKISI